MNALTEILLVTVGIALRIGIPLVVTLIAAYFLRSLDAQWQKQAAAEKPKPGPALAWKNADCVLQQNDPYVIAANPDKPCWQAFRQENGYLNDACLGCKVFQRAPIPAIVR
jgi:hypothetical protein